MKLKVKYDKKINQYYFNIKDFRNIIDISKICFYKLKFKPDNSIVVTFYNKSQKLIKPKVQNDNKKISKKR